MAASRRKPRRDRAAIPLSGAARGPVDRGGRTDAPANRAEAAAPTPAPQAAPPDRQRASNDPRAKPRKETSAASAEAPAPVRAGNESAGAEAPTPVRPRSESAAPAPARARNEGADAEAPAPAPAAREADAPAKSAPEASRRTETRERASNDPRELRKAGVSPG